MTPSRSPESSDSRRTASSPSLCALPSMRSLNHYSLAAELCVASRLPPAYRPDSQGAGHPATWSSLYNSPECNNFESLSLRSWRVNPSLQAKSSTTSLGDQRIPAYPSSCPRASLLRAPIKTRPNGPGESSPGHLRPQADALEKQGQISMRPERLREPCHRSIPPQFSRPVRPHFCIDFLSQGIGLRPQPWAPLCRPVGPGFVRDANFPASL